jgi:hypothetical protein
LARRRKAKVVYRYRKRRSSNKKGSAGLLQLNGIMKPLAATGYGFVRDNISDFIANSAVGRKLPASNFTDEGALLGAMYIMRKLGLAKNKILGSVIRHGETVEWARIGETLSDMRQGKQASSMGANATYVYS